LPAAIFLLTVTAEPAAAQEPWYEQGEFIPEKRIALTVTNGLDIPRMDVPVVIKREQLPVYDFHELDITLVDPSLESRGEPTLEELREYGNHMTHEEQNGRQIGYQLDDLTKDGIWDELFFTTDMEPGESKTIYLYIGFNNYGLFAHDTASGMGNYVRHMVPYWESEFVGWKLWYPTNVDVYAKRTPQLMANHMIQNNLDGYVVPRDMGNDIMFVENTLGGGGIVLFEHSDKPDSISRPRFTAPKKRAGSETRYNIGQLSDTRYSFDVIVNGPLRSMIKARTFNWFSGEGFYELEQTYTAYSRQSYSTVRAEYTQFNPVNRDTKLGAGIRKHPEEDLFHQEGNILFTGGSEEIVSPGDPDRLNVLPVDFTIHAIAVPSKYNPEFQYIEDFGENYTFRIETPENLTFEYLIGSAWSEGEAFETQEEFMGYMESSVRGYENPVKVDAGSLEHR
ncbi:MAG: DUF4861 family protein, partial [Balneolaceae bacterium]